MRHAINMVFSVLTVPDGSVSEGFPPSLLVASHTSDFVDTTSFRDFYSEMIDSSLEEIHVDLPILLRHVVLNNFPLESEPPKAEA